MRNASKLARYMMLRPGENETRNENRRGNTTRNEYGGGSRSEYGGGMSGNYGRGMQNGGGMNGAYNGGYEMENRFRDRRGREHYENGRYAPRNESGMEMRGEGGMQNEMRAAGDMENRRGNSGGNRGGNRRGGTNARYEDMRGEYDDDEEMEMRMNTIGFGNRDYPEPVWERGARIENGGSREMERRSGNKEHGGAYGMEMELTEKKAEEWTKSMHNGDKTTGAHWTMEKTNQLAQQRGVNADPIEFYAVVNAMYSDFCEVAKKHNVHNADFYVDMAKAWLKDPDAVPNKAAMYYEYVVKHED